MIDYNYATRNIINWIRDYFNFQENIRAKAVIGISGGKDSTVCAALLAKAIGPHNVIGILLPCGEQHDIDIAREVVDYLGIQSREYNIQDICGAIYSTLENTNDVMTTNTPARVRMAMLYNVAADIHGRVCNTSNKSEGYVGYCTKWGDNVGDFYLLKNYKVEDVLKIGEVLEVPHKFLYKEPEDGLSGKTDEDNMGVTYKEIDKIIDGASIDNYDHYREIRLLHSNGLHKIFDHDNVVPNYIVTTSEIRADFVTASNVCATRG